MSQLVYKGPDTHRLGSKHWFRLYTYGNTSVSYIINRF